MHEAPPQVRIRPFRDLPLDRAGLAAVIAPGFPHDRWVTDPLFVDQDFGPLFVRGALGAAEQALETPEEAFALLAWGGEEVWGAALGHLETGILEYTPHRIGTLWSLAVLPSKRRRGIATQLFQAVRSWMQDHDCVQLNVATDGPNHANELYRKAGCVERHLLRTWSLDLREPEPS